MHSLYIKIHPEDNVGIAIKTIKENTYIEEGLTSKNIIPQGHKIALEDIEKGFPIKRYGVILGYAISSIEKGSWINEHMLELPPPPSLDNMAFGLAKPRKLIKPERTTFLGYLNKDGSAGTRNLLGISTTVQCVSSVLDVAVDKIRKELLPKYPFVDDVLAINHAYGCGVAINAPDAIIPIRSLQNFVHHPNFGGEVMVIALGCEKLTIDRLLCENDIKETNVITLQEVDGFTKMLDEIMSMADKKLQVLNQRRRVPVPVEKLVIGAQCGGSDAFSGVTGNPAMGYASDLIVSLGGTVMFSEVTEVRDGVHIIAERCVSQDVVNKLASEMRWYDEYLARGSVDRSANPTPGNKKGGLSNIVEKAMGSIAKSGTQPIVEVLSAGELPTKKGLIFAATPASDFVCGASQLASGITLQVFITGRGTTYGLAAVPVVKVSTRDELKMAWNDLIDISAGKIATGEKTVEEVGLEFYNFILDVASGKQTFAEIHGLKNFMTFFNPAPIT